MIFQPVLNLLLILLLAAPVAAAIVFAFLRQPKLRWLWALRFVLLLACIGLVLRPGIPGGNAQTLATDTDIVLAVDTTASIVAEDWNGDEPRLTGVREDIAAIVAAYPGARFSLITFDRDAQVRLPLTTDTTALTSALEVLQPEVTAYSAGSSIGVAADVLRSSLQQAADSAPDRSRMVFYFGDGEQTVSGAPESFSSSSQYVDGGAVFGYGTAEGGPMRITTGTLGDSTVEYIEYQGEQALSVIDEANLETIADELGVGYEHREAGTTPSLPEAPTTTVNYSDSGETGSLIELYWIFAAIIVVILGIEIARGTALIVRMRGSLLRGGKEAGA